MHAEALTIIPRSRAELQHLAEVGLDIAHVTIGMWEDARASLSLVGEWHTFLRENDDIAALAESREDFDRIRESGRLAVMLGVQNTAILDHDIELIAMFRKLGVTVMQLTYNLQNYIGSGYWEAEDTGVSSRFGRLAIEEMNRVGVLIDLSHCGDRTTLDAIELSARPVSITHSNPRALVEGNSYGAGRLAATDAVVALGKRGGFIGLSPLDSLNSASYRFELGEFLDVIDWTVDLIGVDFVGIGSDFAPGLPQNINTWWRYANWSREVAVPYPTADEYDQFPGWFRGAGRYERLGEGLASRGYGDEDVAKILGLNWYRFAGEAIRPAEELAHG